MKNVKLFPVLMLLGVSVAVLLPSCQKEPDESSALAEEYSAEVPLKWYKLFEEIDRYAPGYRPPAAARALGYIGLAGYEAALPGMPSYNTFSGFYNGLALPQSESGEEYYWPAAVNAAYYAMFQHFYPHVQASHLDAIEQLNETLEASFAGQADQDVIDRSAQFGKAIADAIYDWSSTDAAGHNAYLDPRPASYTPPSGPGLWQPTWPDYTPALFPYWGQARTFAMKQSELLAEPPLAWSEDPNSPIYNQAKETQIWVDQINAGQDDEAYWIAQFWSDDFGGVTFTPAGRWIAIASQAATAEDITLEEAVALYAQMGMALCDAGIAVWKSKFHYNYERPIHFIRRNFDASWETLMNNPATGVTGITPEFPAYPSGHSGFGGAAGIVLTNAFGYSYDLTDNCHKDRTEFNGAPRSFSSFIDMAVENAYSRIPLGVHFRMDCDEGLRQGYLAGQRVIELPWRK